MAGTYSIGLRFQLDFSRSSLKRFDGVKDMDEKDVWAQDLARQILARKKGEQLQTMQFVAEQELLRNKAPQLWEQLLEEIKTRTELLSTAIGQNPSLHYRQMQLYKAEVLSGNSVVASFEFQPPSLVVLHYSNTMDKIDAKVINGEVVWATKLGNTSAELARFVLQHVARHI